MLPLHPVLHAQHRTQFYSDVGRLKAPAQPSEGSFTASTCGDSFDTIGVVAHAADGCMTLSFIGSPLANPRSKLRGLRSL